MGDITHWHCVQTVAVYFCEGRIWCILYAIQGMKFGVGFVCRDLVFSREKSGFNEGRYQNLEILMPQKHVLLVIWEFIGLAQLWLCKL